MQLSLLKVANNLKCLLFYFNNRISFNYSTIHIGFKDKLFVELFVFKLCAMLNFLNQTRHLIHMLAIENFNENRIIF